MIQVTDELKQNVTWILNEDPVVAKAAADLIPGVAVWADSEEQLRDLITIAVLTAREGNRSTFPSRSRLHLHLIGYGICVTLGHLWTEWAERTYQLPGQPPKTIRKRDCPRCATDEVEGQVS